MNTTTLNPDPVCAPETALEINRRCWADAKKFKPPQDGTPIVAVGRVIVTQEDFGCVDPFVLAVRYEKDSSGYEGWHHVSNDMTVASDLDDKVIIDFWNPMPVEAA